MRHLRSAMRVAAFILSDVRSGSTLLDQCLGAHADIVTLGEAHWLAAYATLDRSQYDPVHELVCACGETVGTCPFWSSVGTAMGRPLESLRLHSQFVRSSRQPGIASRIAFLPRRAVRRWPKLYRQALVRRALGGNRLAADIISLSEAACAVSGKGICVDSSKSPFRFRAVRGLDPLRSKAIVLVRDVRAVVHSKMKRGESLEHAAVGWRVVMRHIEALTRDLPAASVHRLSYESLCEDPRSELTRLCGFLGVEFSEGMLQRPAAGSVHHIGGSPSKFDAARTEIVLDRSHEGAFSDPELARMRRLVGEMASRQGY